MLKSISLENYKCFKNRTEIEIAPLTVLCGINSSGKSSILNSLLMLKQSYENNFTSNSMVINGSYIKCGSFADISTSSNNRPVSFENEFILEKPEKYERQSNLILSKFDITAFKTLLKLFPKNNQITKFIIKSRITIKKDDNAGKMRDNVLDECSIEIQTYIDSTLFINTKIMLKHIQGKQYTITAENIPNGSSGEIVSKVTLKSCACYFENFNLINVYANSIKPKNILVDNILANIYLIFRINAMQYKNIKYLTPLRVYPQSNYILDDETENVGIGGEFTPHIIYNYSNKNIRSFQPPTDNVISTQTIMELFPILLNEWMHYLGFGDCTLRQAFETIKLDISDYNILNVGFGVSQVLPILVSGLLQREKEVLLLEQPEIHLHPKAQMSIADFLISMAVNGRGVIIETHSDHIINRIVRRMMEDPTIHQNIKIYFVDQNQEGVSCIEEIIVDNIRGVLTENENFFTQFASETEKIIYAGFANQIKQG